MTLMRYLLEYTLETVCHGNRSECARRMGMEYTELRKIRKRMSEGSVSNRATEALLEMYWREGLSLDEALRQYTHTKFGSDIETAEQICNELVTEVRESIQAESHNSQNVACLLKAAYELVEQIQRTFCEDICQRTRYQDIACPAKRLVDFVNWLREERETLNRR